MPSVLVDFVGLPRIAAPFSLALAPAIETCRAGRVRLLSHLRADVLEDGEMIDRGLHACPCEIDVELSKLIRRAGPSYAFDFFFEPQDDDVESGIDIELHRSMDGRKWTVERLLARCRDGIVRNAPIQIVSGQELRLRMRFGKRTDTAVRVWMREPKGAPMLRTFEQALAHA